MRCDQKKRTGNNQNKGTFGGHDLREGGETFGLFIVFFQLSRSWSPRANDGQ